MDIKSLLNDAGLKCTKQRQEVLSVLNDANKPLTADEIHLKIDDIAFSTIYRTIDKLLESGILVRTTIPKSDGIYYELTQNEHRHYAICLKCHEMRYIDNCPIHEHETEIENFTVTSHKLELYGYCDKCKKL